MAGDPGRRPTSATSQSLARLCRGRLGVRRASGSLQVPWYLSHVNGIDRLPGPSRGGDLALAGTDRAIYQPSTATPGAPLPPRWDMHIYQDRACGWQGGKVASCAEECREGMVG
jgi:hypothetical protein